MCTSTYMRKCKNIMLAFHEMILVLLMWKFSFVGFMQHKCTKLEPVTVKECVYKWWPFNQDILDISKIFLLYRLSLYMYLSPSAS